MKNLSPTINYPNEDDDDGNDNTWLWSLGDIGGGRTHFT